MNLSTRVATALSVALAAALSGIPAHAAIGHEYPDARGDVVTGLDLHKVRLTSTGDSIIVRTKHRDLRGAASDGGSLSIFLDVDRSHRGPDFAFVGGTSRGTDYALVRVHRWKLGDRLHKAEIDMDIDYARNTVRVRLDRAAMGDPQQVRIAVRADGQRSGGRLETDWLRSARHTTAWVTLDTDV